MRIQGTARSTVVLLAGLLLMSDRAYAEDRQVRPFIGATFGGGTTFVDPERVIGRTNLAIGASAVFLGEMFGAEAEIADAPGFFESGDTSLVLGSRVTTLTGSIVVAAPRRLTEYSLRPYVVGGGGLMRVRMMTASSVYDFAKVIPVLDVGVGVVGFVTNRMGVCWDVRRFQSVNRNTDNVGLSFGDEHLSFWRATMAVAIRY
jgi:hypothetical protein